MSASAAKWHGLNELLGIVHRLAKPISRGELEQDLLHAVHEGGVVERARSNAPKSSGRPTHGPAHGYVSITAEVVEGRPRATVAVGHTKDGWWLRFAELGTARQPARPWLRPAVDATADGVAQALANRLKARIEGAA